MKTKYNHISYVTIEFLSSKYKVKKQKTRRTTKGTKEKDNTHVIGIHEV